MSQRNMEFKRTLAQNLMSDDEDEEIFQENKEDDDDEMVQCSYRQQRELSKSNWETNLNRKSLIVDRDVPPVISTKVISNQFSQNQSESDDD